MKLVLIRHGLPLRTETTADAPLSDLGRAQADAVARWISREGIDVLYTSPMIRARQTAEPFESVMGLSATVLEGVAEYDRHSGRYIPIEEIKAADKAAWRKSMADNSAHNLAEFRKIVVDELTGVIAAHPGQTVAVTCHGGVINVWASHVLGLPQARMFFLPDYTSVNRFVCSSAGHLTVVSLNETAHLRELADG